MNQQKTWAGLSTSAHARSEIERAKGFANFPEGVPYSYRLQVVDDDIDSESGILFESSRFEDPEAAAMYARTHFAREYDFGLYQIRPIRITHA